MSLSNLHVAALATLSLAFAPLATGSGADKLPKRAPEPSVSVSIAPAAPGKSGMSVSARDAQGVEHEVQMETRDGRVIVKGTPDPSRPWLGVLLSDPEEIERMGSGLPSKERRWTVTAVADDSPAARAGLKRGDVIVGVQGRDVLVGGPGMLEGAKPGDTLAFDIERDTKPMTVRVTVSGHPGTVEFEDADGLGTLDLAGSVLGSLKGLEALKSLKALKSLPCPPGARPEDCLPGLLAIPGVGGPRLGVSVEPMGEQLAKYFGVPEGRGLLVKDVVDASPAAEGGIEAGDVILEVDGDEIRAAGDIRSALQDRSPGDAVRVKLLRRGKPVEVTVTLEDDERRGSLLGADPGQAALIAEQALAQARRALASREADEQVRAAQEAMRQAQQELKQATERAFDRDEVRREVERALRDAMQAREEALRELRESGGGAWPEHGEAVEL